MDQRLEAACHSGDLDMLHSLLREDKLLLHRFSITASIDNPLHIAASLGHTEFSEELIIRNPDLASELNSRGLSALHLASAHGHISIVKHLISKVGSHLCLLKDKDGRLPVHTATMKGRITILEELINACPESARALTYQKESVLHLAVQFNSFETFEYLAEKLGVGGEINDELLNLKDDKGNTILHHAVARRQLKTVKLLLSKDGMEVNSMNLKGLTALDVLLESPSEHGDLMLGEMIRAANGKLSGEVNHQPSMQNNTTPTPTDESGTAPTRRSWVRSLFRRRHTYSRLGQQSKKQAKVGDNYTPGQLMVVATLIATITFQSGLNPPGGFTQDDGSTGNNTGINNSPKAGVAILRSDLGGFLLYDMIGLFASLSIILILICVVPTGSKKAMMKTLVVIMWVSVFSTALAFSAGIALIFPDSNRKKSHFLISGWFWILRIFMLWVWFRFSVYLLRKVRLWRQKEGDEESNAVRRGGCLLCCKRIGAVMLILVLLLFLGCFYYVAIVGLDLNKELDQPIK